MRYVPVPRLHREASVNGDAWVDLQKLFTGQIPANNTDSLTTSDTVSCGVLIAARTMLNVHGNVHGSRNATKKGAGFST